MLNPSVRHLALAAVFAALAAACPGGAGEGEEGEGEGEEGEGEEGEGEEGEGEEGEGEEGEGEEGEGEEGEGEEGEGEDNCSNGTDDDGDVLIDLADPGCYADPPSEANDDQCNDGLDNDYDFIVDQDDPFCVSDGHEATITILPDLAVHGVREDVFSIQGVPDPDGQPRFATRNVDGSEEEFADGCFSGLGERTIIEFNGIISNVGDRDLRIGDTSDHTPPWSTNNGFGDLQLEGWLRFFVLDSTGAVAAEGHKGSFCMIDLMDLDPADAITANFGDCNNGQGITAGFADIYRVGLPCQFVDITGVAPGDYTLRIETNFLGELLESDPTNNFAELTFVIP